MKAGSVSPKAGPVKMKGGSIGEKARYVKMKAGSVAMTAGCAKKKGGLRKSEGRAGLVKNWAGPPLLFQNCFQSRFTTVKARQEGGRGPNQDG